MLTLRSTITLGVLCVCALCAIAAPGAFAEERAYTCEEVESEGFSDSHCVNSGAGPYGHAEIAESLLVSVTNERTAEETTTAAISKLKGSIAGVATEVQCTSVAGSGSLTNAASSVTGTATLEYSGCTVTLPAGKSCEINGGEIVTNQLTATTSGQTANNVKITPPESGILAKVPIESCSISSLNNTFPVTGSFLATATGATLSTTHTGVTAQKTLKFGGVKAGLDGSTTVTGRVVIPPAVTLT